MEIMRKCPWMVGFLCSILFLVFFSFSSLNAAPPGIDAGISAWGTCTWTENAAAPSTGLSHRVYVYDYNGIADDGSSHSVRVTYPNSGPVKNLAFTNKINQYTAVYYYFDNQLTQTMSQYSGPYVYRATRNSNSEWSEAVDNVSANPLPPPNEATFSIKFDPPQSITAFFDNVWVNGALYDNFDSGFDPAKWKNLPGQLSYTNGEVRAEVSNILGSNSYSMNLQNPDQVQSIRAKVRVETTTGNLPKARVWGYFANSPAGGIFADLSLRENEVTYVVLTSKYDGNHQIQTFLIPNVTLGPVTIGRNYELSIEWDGATFHFGVTGLNDSVNYTATYTPPGPITALTNSSKGIGLRFTNEINTTTPTFSWAPVSGAAYYEVKIYGANDQSIYIGYVKSPPYTLPPGILKPSVTDYKYRIWAMRDHQWAEGDNASASGLNMVNFRTGPSEAQNPYIDLWSIGVGTFREEEDPTNVLTNLYAKIFDAQGVPGNIKSVKVLFPDGNTEVDLLHNYNETSTSALYQGLYYGSIQPGIYTFTVRDKNGNSDTKTEELIPNPIAPATSLQPVNNQVIGSTEVIFDWDDVPGASIYEVELYDKDLNYLFEKITTESQAIFPAGILKEENLYRYRVRARREFFENNSDNESAAPPYSAAYLNTFLTTSKLGVSTPSLDLSYSGVSVMQYPNQYTRLPRYVLAFTAFVTDSDGVPENIKKVEVEYPDGTKKLLKYVNSPTFGTNYQTIEMYSDPLQIQSGNYTFRVFDFEGNQAEAFDFLPIVSGNVIPWPTNFSPAHNSTVRSLTPVISWSSIPNVSYYRLNIMNAYGTSTIHRSPNLSTPQYTVPAGVLDLNMPYSYRVYVYKEPVGTEIDFYATNNQSSGGDIVFYTPDTVVAGDFDSDGDVDGSDLAALIANAALIDITTFALNFGWGYSLPTVQKDCYVLQLRPDQNFNNTELFTGKMTDQNGGIGYSLIQIDVNSLPNTVSSVILSLKNSLYQRSDQAGFYSSGKLQAFKVNSNWDQTSTTWNNKPAYDAQFFSESPTFSTFSSEWVDIDITYLYNLWKSGTTNYGILLKTDGVDTAGYCNGSKEYNCRPGSFYSSDHENVSFRPMLLISP